MRQAGLVFFALFLVFPVFAQNGGDPGERFEISPSGLPKPHATPSPSNPPDVVTRPKGVMPIVPPGFTVSVFADKLMNARWVAVAPNGDVFLAEPRGGKITRLVPNKDPGAPASASTFASGFSRPHGMAFRNGNFYVADMKGVWQLPYKDGQTKETGRRKITRPSDLTDGGHWTRNIAFDSKGGLYIAIGSANNVGEESAPRASVQKVQPDGTLKTFASGLRNPVGIAFYPGTDELYVVVNERDGLGDGLVPDYLTRIRDGEFYGWPYAYIGRNPDPDFGSKRPDLVAKTRIPDTLFASHSAPLGLVFYEGDQFPPEYKGDAFVALHGSWNAGKPTGYKVVRVHFENGRPARGYENFVTGFRIGGTTTAQVWGRPVGLAVARDGSLLIADDAADMVWRVAYTGRK